MPFVSIDYDFKEASGNNAAPAAAGQSQQTGHPLPPPPQPIDDDKTANAIVAAITGGLADTNTINPPSPAPAQAPQITPATHAAPVELLIPVQEPHDAAFAELRELLDQVDGTKNANDPTQTKVADPGNNNQQTSVVELADKKLDDLIAKYPKPTSAVDKATRQLLQQLKGSLHAGTGQKPDCQLRLVGVPVVDSAGTDCADPAKIKAAMDIAHAAATDATNPRIVASLAAGFNGYEHHTNLFPTPPPQAIAGDPTKMQKYLRQQHAVGEHIAYCSDPNNAANVAKAQFELRDHVKKASMQLLDLADYEKTQRCKRLHAALLVPFDDPSYMQPQAGQPQPTNIHQNRIADLKTWEITNVSNVPATDFAGVTFTTRPDKSSVDIPPGVYHIKVPDTGHTPTAPKYKSEFDISVGRDGTITREVKVDTSKSAKTTPADQLMHSFEEFCKMTPPGQKVRIDNIPSGVKIDENLRNQISGICAAQGVKYDGTLPHANTVFKATK